MTLKTSRRSRRLVHVALVLFPGLQWSQTSSAQTTSDSSDRAPSASPSEPAVATSISSGTVAGDDDRDHRCRENWLAFGRCRDRPWEGPRITFGLDLGASAMNESEPFGFRKGVGSVTEPGPAWGARIGVDLLSWLGVEGRYLGMYNSVQAAVSPAGAAGYLTSALDALVRLTLPLRYVNPYAVGGVGYYDVSLDGSSQAIRASIMHSSSQPALVVGIGLEVPLTWHLGVGIEADYHHQSNESFSVVTTNGVDGGDLTTFDVVVRARL